MERQAEGPLSFYQRFLRITFRTFRCSCARIPTYTRNPMNVHAHTHAPPAFSFLSVLPLVSVDLLFYPSPPFSFCLSSSSFHRLRSPRHYCTYVYMCMCVRASSQSSREVSCRAALRSRGERAALYVGERENVF